MVKELLKEREGVFYVKSFERVCDMCRLSQDCVEELSGRGAHAAWLIGRRGVRKENATTFAESASACGVRDDDVFEIAQLCGLEVVGVAVVRPDSDGDDKSILLTPYEVALVSELQVEAMRRCDVVHLATHGVPDGVLLGAARLEDGKLSMGEVQSLELRARLVVLSECDSFRGKLSSSDGVIGITRAFVAAGAPTLVASLWKVDDAATRELMGRFYARLLEGGAVGDATAAMQGAMVSMIREQGRRQWRVLEWAAFVVYGL